MCVYFWGSGLDQGSHAVSAPIREPRPSIGDWLLASLLLFVSLSELGQGSCTSSIYTWSVQQS